MMYGLDEFRTEYSISLREGAPREYAQLQEPRDSLVFR